MLDFKPFQTVKISTVISYKYLKSLFFYSYFPIPPQQTHEAGKRAGMYTLAVNNAKGADYSLADLSAGKITDYIN